MEGDHRGDSSPRLRDFTIVVLWVNGCADQGHSSGSVSNM